MDTDGLRSGGGVCAFSGAAGPTSHMWSPLVIA